MEGHLQEQDGTIYDYDADGREILVQVGEVNPDEPYIGLVHPESVLPVEYFDAESNSVAVRLPEPWSEVQEGIPLAPDVIIAVAGQEEPPRIETLTQSQAREMFPVEFEPLTQDKLDRLWAED